MQPRNNLDLAVGCSMIEMRRSRFWTRSNFGEAAWFNFILPI
jgi:hypothetical protein